MGLNISKGNMYKFVDFTWNTVKGMCPHGCSYCMCKRYGNQPELHFDKKELREFDRDMGQYGAGHFIFVGSSCDMFAKGIPDEWVYETLAKCEDYANKYLFQTKNPARIIPIDWAMPPKTTICTTIETNRWIPEVMGRCPTPDERASAMAALSRFERYVTIEPIMAFDVEPMVDRIMQCEPVQVNIGADSQNSGLPEPTAEEILVLAGELEKFTRVEWKPNIGRILGRTR